MADNTIPSNDPGIAGFATESWASRPEPRFGDTPAPTTHETVTVAANTALPLYSVIRIASGVLELADQTDGAATGILAMPINMAANQSMSIAYYRGGTWDMQALNWDATFNTDAKKIHAFEGGPSPMILIQKKKFSNSAIPV